LTLPPPLKKKLLLRQKLEMYPVGSCAGSRKLRSTRNGRFFNSPPPQKLKKSRINLKDIIGPGEANL